MQNNSAWRGEVAYLVATLALLNSKNVAETENVEFGKKNQRRVKEGKLPLFSYRLAGISGRYKARHVGDALNIVGHRAASIGSCDERRTTAPGQSPSVTSIGS
jgi:hypothetical protein